MMLEKTKKAFVELGKFLAQFKESEIVKKSDVLNNDLFFDDFLLLIENQKHHNGWFIESEVYFSIQSWANALTPEHLDQWLLPYNISEKSPKIVGLILAGNVPLVGFHDFLSVLITGHKALVKTSSNDKQLIVFLAEYLMQVEPSLKNRIEFTEGQLKEFDAVIATGSNNTARYFEYYFKDKPSIIRKNRNSVAILTGNETDEQLTQLSHDIFRYYGLGCRNVSKLFIPRGYNFDSFFKAMYLWHPIINEHKYANNYDYNKAVYLMSEFDMLENGFLMIKEDASYASPIATLFYEYYESLEDLRSTLDKNSDNIQCVVSNNLFNTDIAFGDTQNPRLWDFADGVDTLKFLLKI